jgi:hypothetical protein
VGAAEVGTATAEAAEVEAAEVVNSTKVGTAEVGTATVDAAEVALDIGIYIFMVDTSLEDHVILHNEPIAINATSNDEAVTLVTGIYIYLW